MGLIKMYARPITYKVNGPGTTATAQGYVATPVRYSTISVEDLADHISADSRVERSKVAVITDSLIKQIREMVLNGHKIEIPHLGSFKPKIKSSMAINPESVDAASFTAKVKFTPSVELKRDLQASRIMKTTLPIAPDSPDIEVQKRGIIADFKKECIRLIKLDHPADFDASSLKVTIGGLGLGVDTAAVQGTMTLDGKNYTINKAIKARDWERTGTVWEFINSTKGELFTADDYELFNGWEGDNTWRGADTADPVYGCTDFYKVTEPFKAPAIES